MDVINVLTRRENMQLKMHSVTIEDMVPANHFLRKLDALVDFSFVYEKVRALYSENNGRPSIDPVTMLKYLLLGFLFGIASERRIEQEIEVNMAYRWFLGLDIDDRVPDHSTISQLRRRKFKDTKLIQELFAQVLKQCVDAGLVDGRLLLTDSTHIKANASKTSKIKVEIEKDMTEFFKQLDAYEAEERKRLGMPEIVRKMPEPKKTEQTKSVTDPEAGWLNRPNKPDGFHYLSHQTVDAKNGIIVDVAVTAGNVSDNVPFLEQVDRCDEKLGALNIEVDAVCADSAYDTAIIHKEMETRKIAIYTPEKETSDSTKVEYKRDAFIYNQETDEFTCPMGEVLILRTLQRTETGVYREYRSDSKICRQCPNREKCLSPSQKSRKIQVNIFQHIVDRHHYADSSEEYDVAMRKRQILAEGTFAAQKAYHNLKGLHRRGIEAAEEHCLMSAIAINLKRLVKHAGVGRSISIIYHYLRFWLCIFAFYPRKMLLVSE
jgi:transposase